MYAGEIPIPVSRLKGVGPQTAKVLSNLDILTVGDLLSWWPRDWEDRTVSTPLSRFAERKKIHTIARVASHDWFGAGRMKTLKLIIEDDEGTLAELICFNRPFLEKQFPVDSRVSVYGSFRIAYGSIQSSAFEIDLDSQLSRTVFPVYPLTASLTQIQMRKIISSALDSYAKGIDSELPQEVRSAHGIPAKHEILHMMHRPHRVEEATTAKEALIFEELYLFELAIGRHSLKRRGRLPAIDISDQSTERAMLDSDAQSKPLLPLQQRLVERLPFSLTDDQVNCILEINADITGETPMARLLQGDVGSGKTLVSFMAALAVIEQGGQVALLAPTELLARQHAEGAATLLEVLGVRLAYLTGNVRASGRKELLTRLASGEIDVIVGTHALFSQKVQYKNLRLAIIDEQHRFGVRQRAAIQEKGMEGGNGIPHLLMMSATPIPRTLALSVFGDLDVSTIRSLPGGRKPIITHLARKGNEGKVYDFVRTQLAAGRQAYFVYPLIDPSEEGSLKAATVMFTSLAKDIFPDYSCKLIHSRIPEDEQRLIMSAFREGKVHVLVATSVVEVGVDVPNATCMVIEHAERFGLSALHQMRGRVGRGSEQSFCFLIYDDKLTEEGKARIKVMHETTDGFAIAEKDLHIRGPGEMTGIRQSGYAGFTLADPVRDYDILVKARKAAFDYLEKYT